VKTKQYFLVLASLAVAPIALGYGSSPEWFARTFFGVVELDLNFTHMLRAIMSAYLALGLFWLFSAFSDKYRDAALLSTVVLLAGQGAGRTASIVIDGRPSSILLVYTILEGMLTLIALWVWRLPE
jgi:hypothetical protein